MTKSWSKEIQQWQGSAEDEEYLGNNKNRQSVYTRD
jgi:hypothetical protein